MWIGGVSLGIIFVYMFQLGRVKVCIYESVWWACAGPLGSESIKTTGSQLARGLICSSVAVNYSQCQAGSRGGV